MPSSRRSKKQKLPSGGDCYEAAGKFIGDQLIAGETDRYILVHGEVRGQGPLMGVTFGHAWIVDTSTDNVIDKSNGRDISLPRFIYYGIGGINDLDNHYEYTAEEARDKMLETGNYGPWDLITSSGL
jgi:hypothetical protein